MTLVSELVERRPERAPTDGPTVSIVVTSRDGEAHLRRLLDGLARRTHYAAIELVVVDNASEDGSLALLDEWSGPKRVVHNRTNQSFSVANNQGIRAATGEFVLLANNDIDPIHPHWLGWMVESLDDDVAAVGALLVYPERPRGDTQPQHPDLTVQHRGVAFQTSKWGVRAVNVGAGQDPLAIDPPRRREVPAVTAACLLARRRDLLAEPFDEAYWYGSEDWDLCLRLRSRGTVVVDERAVLFHHEFATQDAYRSQAWLDRRTDNHQWFNGRWGPSLLRARRAELTGAAEVRVEGLAAPPDGWFHPDRVRRVHVTTGGHDDEQPLVARLRTEAEAAGWELVTGPPQRCDLAIALAPPDDVQWFLQQDPSVALVLDREEEWGASGAADAAGRVFTPNPVVAARLGIRWGRGLGQVLAGIEHADQPLFTDLLARCRPDPRSLRIGISTCPDDWKRAQGWGDTYLARGLGRSFRRLGHEPTELIREDWRSRAAASCDVVLHLRGIHRRPVARGQRNLLWIISHPEQVEPDEYDDYDVVATASRSHAEHLTQQLGRPVHFVPQATDADTFAVATYDPDFDDAILVVAIGRHPVRRGPRWLMRSGRRFQLYGHNWEDFPEAPFVVAHHLHNRKLPDAYHSAAVVVADHHGSMRTEGFLANRLFDVLAAGGVVVSDDVSGLEEVFGDLVPSYATAAQLDACLDSLLADPARRRRLARAGRELVLAEHTLDHRARQWLDLLDDLPEPASS